MQARFEMRASALLRTGGNDITDRGGAAEVQQKKYSSFQCFADADPEGRRLLKQNKAGWHLLVR